MNADDRADERRKAPSVHNSAAPLCITTAIFSQCKRSRTGKMPVRDLIMLISM